MTTERKLYLSAGLLAGLGGLLILAGAITFSGNASRAGELTDALAHWNIATSCTEGEGEGTK